MDAASQVADAITLTENTGVFNPLSDSEYSGWNPYFEMFSAEDMSGYSEVLFWKDYLRSGSINTVSYTHLDVYKRQIQT